MNTIHCFGCREHHSTTDHPWVVTGRGRHYCSAECIPQLGRFRGVHITPLGKYEPPKKAGR